MKKILTFACLFFAICGYAYDFEQDGFQYDITSLSDLTVSLSGTSNISGDVVIPTSVSYANRTFVVTSIENSAFSGSTLHSLTIPENILSASISGQIDSLIIEDSDVPLSSLKVSNTEKAYIGRNVSDYRAYSFAFSNIKSVIFGNKVTYISFEEFGECPYLSSVTLSNSIKEIYQNAFHDCYSLISISGESVERIGTEAFTNCVSLTSFSFPKLKYIENGDSQWGTYRWGAFQGCSSLNNVVLPAGLVSVGTMAFMDCSSLSSITLPASLTTLGDSDIAEYSSVFANCPLSSITVYGEQPINIGETTFDSQTYIGATLHVPAQSLQAYQTADSWKNFFNIVGDITDTDSIRSVNINGCSTSYGGYVEIGGKQYTDNNFSLTSKLNDIISIVFYGWENENEAYELGKVEVNGIDVTNQIQNNTLNLTISGNTTIDINWDYAEPNPTLLTIKHAENGCVKLEVSEWYSYKFHIVPSENWQIHTVSYNGNDITNSVNNGVIKLSGITSDAELNITFAAETTGTTNAVVSKVKVYGNNGSIIITNADINDNIAIYTETGLLVTEKKAQQERTIINLNNGLYIVKVGSLTVKVII